MKIDIPQNDKEIFGGALHTLNEAGLPYVVAGAFCMHYYTGRWRYTKDMDLFALPEVVPTVLATLGKAGFKTWIEADHWLGKGTKNGCMVDVIFGSGNWLTPIDELWLDRSQGAELLGEPVRMAPVEEMIWVKAYIGGRERYDGGDVCHLIRARAGNFDWRHLLWRFGGHWQLLLSHLSLYSFVYPSHQADIPDWLLRDLIDRWLAERRQPAGKNICRGTLLDRFLYNYDVEQLGYVDARERYARQHGRTVADVANEREWARDKLARGEVYKETGH